MAIALSDLTSAVTSALANLPSSENIQDAERMQLLGPINTFQEALEPPIGMGIFNAFAEAQGAELTLEELPSKTKGDVELLNTTHHALSLRKNRICNETGKETYQPLPLAMAFGDNTAPGAMIKHFHVNLQISVKLFEYFESNGYTNTKDSFDAPFQLTYNKSDHYFDWLQKNPGFQDAFHLKYPVTERLDTNSERVTLVDIGGGVRHDLTALKKQYPDILGKLILQDLPHVIDTIKEPLSEGISLVAHNMFDTTDSRCQSALEILARTREAMAEDSVLLGNEHTTPDGSNVPPYAAAPDLHMMEVFSALERTEEQWVNLLEKAGFTVVKIWKCEEDLHSNALYEAIPNNNA
ncbi:hypothetical protein BDV12DRAFT_184892 [Aspergillus spectabilis]